MGYLHVGILCPLLLLSPGLRTQPACAIACASLPPSLQGSIKARKEKDLSTNDKAILEWLKTNK